MLKRNDLIKELGAEYINMINKINIADFTKCIAQYANIDLQYLKDEVIKDYLVKWARNKKHLFDFLGDIRVDMPITFIDENENYGEKILNLGIEYPVYFPWLHMFRATENNKIQLNNLNYTNREMINSAFPNYNIEGVSLTHFFKSKLEAPDELVTAIGRVWEHSSINATFTISIDPVDIMLASENPYNWTSCYRLENDFEESHADGCLAGVLDNKTLITYIWNKEGKFDLYDKYEFKKIRYKMMRMTIAINKTFNAVHFNTIYPGKGNLSDDFYKLLRTKVEDYICGKTSKINFWNKRIDLNAIRCYGQYGYSEYSDSNVWAIKDEEEYGDLMVYNEPILCPCGCGDQYIGTGSDDNYWYNGYGHTNDNYEERGTYCEYTEEYEECDGDCINCPTYNRNNMVCELDENERCYDRNCWDAEDEGDFDSYENNVVRCNPEHCAECPLYKLHHPEEIEEEEKEPNNDIPDAVTYTIKSLPIDIDNGLITPPTIVSSAASININQINKDLAFYKIIGKQDFTIDDFNTALERIYEDPINPNYMIYELSNFNKLERLNVAIPKEIINNQELVFDYVKSNIR